MFLLAHGANPDTRRNDGATPLWIASQMGHDDVVRQLLKAGAKVDVVRRDGATPLFKAAHKGYTQVVIELLKYKPCLGILPVSFFLIQDIIFSFLCPQLEMNSLAR